ncbi:MAG TPA: hypothetical protein VMH20_11785 [Verrucomicrobiae bacterium]|nr:hypothetical protein [Verrucomicrobiae bacterium]
MKKQLLVALALLLLIPVVWVLGGLLFSAINPEIAAGHPNYVRNFHLLSLLKIMVLWASAALTLILWLLACLLVIRSKQRSLLWLFCAALGPLGFAILVALNDNTTQGTDPHARFVRNLNWFLRLAYEAFRFGLICVLAYLAMLLHRNLMILFESARTGMSVQQIIGIQNASSGMWAFSEGIELMYLVVLLYLLWPILFNVVARLTVTAAPKQP